ncbi:MAG: diguanylate cyclase [Nitrospirae bacterium]|nr:diguanylate cyclase [Nitrospirota bacterium]
MIKLIRRVFTLKSIYTKLFLLFFMVGVVPLILGSFYAYYNSRNALLNAALKEHEIEATNGMRNIITLFVESNVNILLTAKNVAFVRYFEEPDEREVYRKGQKDALLQIISLFPNIIESVGFADKNGRALTYVFNGNLLPGEKHINFSGRTFFKEALTLQTGEIYHDLPEISSLSKRWVISSATPVFSGNGMLHGILYIQIYLDGISQLIKNIAHPEDIILVVDHRGRMIAHSKMRTGEILPVVIKPTDDPSFRSAIRSMITGEGGSMRIIYDGKPSHITYKSIPGERHNQNIWSLAVITDEGTIYGGASAGKYLVFVLAVSAVLFAIAGILGRWVSSPIQRLTSTSVAMSQGDLSSRVNIERVDEIGQLAHAFNEMAASIQATHEELLRLSTTDGLTALYNHKEFHKRLEEEIRRASRYGSVLSLLMIDIDNFKKFNDTYGHQVGDTVLKTIGATILKEIRGSDFAARYGGEEMALILPETGVAEAFLFSERLRKDIQQMRVKVLKGETVYVTVSTGIATFPGDASSREGLVDAADQALYFAKKKGRNKTILYGETIESLLEHKPEKAEALIEAAEDWIFKDLSTAVEARLPFHRGHFDAVSGSAMKIAELIHMNSEESKELRIATMLYEVGALNLPPDILLKQGALTDDEWKIVKTHPEQGVELLSKVLKIHDILPAIRHHHEHYDGTGYPLGLKGEEIPLLARIISVVDAYHAMTAVSPYRRKLTREEAVAELKRNAGTQFDPRIVEVFIRTLHEEKVDTADIRDDISHEEVG